MRSKWSRVLRFAAEFKNPDEPLGDFIKRKGGINECAARFGRRLGRKAHKPGEYNLENRSVSVPRQELTSSLGIGFDL